MMGTYVIKGNSCIGCESINAFPTHCGGCGNLKSVATIIKMCSELQAENERYKDSLGRIINLSEGMRFDVYDRTGFISELRAINGAARQALQPPKEPDNKD